MDFGDVYLAEDRHEAMILRIVAHRLGFNIRQQQIANGVCVTKIKRKKYVRK